MYRVCLLAKTLLWLLVIVVVLVALVLMVVAMVVVNYHTPELRRPIAFLK